MAPEKPRQTRRRRLRRKGSRRSARSASSAAPFQFCAQHVEEQHVRRADETDGVLRTPANHLVATVEEFALLAVDGQVRAVAAIDYANHALIRHNHRTICERMRTNGCDRERS